MDQQQYEIIEDYLSGKMSQAERSAFESALTTDKELATAFRLYQVIETHMSDQAKYEEETTALTKTLQSLGEKYLAEEAGEQRRPRTGQQREPRIGQKRQLRIGHRNRMTRPVMLAAACLVLALAAYLFFANRPSSPRQLAARYTSEQLLHISQTMGGPADSLQQAITAYNDGDYPKALALLESLEKTDPSKSDVLKYTGLACLATQNYDKALGSFMELAGRKGLYSNPGKFLAALTLLQRNKEGDIPRAKQLLQEVVNEKEEDSKTAAEWLKEF
jgi:hypothetical protein